MKAYVYPADEFGCGYYRLIWPAHELKLRGHDVEIIMPKQRGGSLQAKVQGDEVVGVGYPEDADVIVLQRITHGKLVQAIRLMRERGVAVVIDMDDDLAAIDPHNPAFMAMHPQHGYSKDHSWLNTQRACEAATLVTVSTDALLSRYAPHGRGVVIRNCVPARYLKIPHVDSDVVGWGGALHTHPNDVDVLGTAITQVVDRGGKFRVVGPRENVARVLRIEDTELEATGPQDLHTEWAESLAELGIGIAPLADTKFNRSKSWLKPLEYSALGVPVVMSPREEYRRVHTLGVGLLADKPKHWVSKLTQLRTSAAMRRDFSEAGRTWAASQTIEGNAWRWWEAWDHARELAGR